MLKEVLILARPMTNLNPMHVDLIPLRVACAIGLADSLVALATAVLTRPDLWSLVFGCGWVAIWAGGLVGAAPLARAVRARPWALVPVAAIAMVPALLDGGYPGSLATQPMWLALVAVAAASWRVAVATGAALCAAKIAVFLATGTSAGVLLPGGEPPTEATTAAFAPLAVALLGLVLAGGLRRVLEAWTAEAAPAAVPAEPVAVAADAERAPTGATARLRPAERAVVALLAEGLTPKQIAHARGTSLETVRTQIKRAKRTTGARTLDELVATTWRPR